MSASGPLVTLPPLHPKEEDSKLGQNLTLQEELLSTPFQSRSPGHSTENGMIWDVLGVIILPNQN